MKGVNIILTFLALTGNQYLGLAQTNINTIQYIKHGTSFGMCKGYCFHETYFDSKRTVLLRKSWSKGQNNNEPDKIDTLKSEIQKWDLLIKNIDLNKFYKLPKRIGCPDCADGGTEWIEIGTKHKIYKIEFECRKDIEAIKEFLKLIRMKN